MNNLKLIVSIVCIVSICFLVASLFGFNYFQGLPDESYEDESDDLTVIGFSQLGSESLWRSANSESVQEVFQKDNGYLLIFNNARQKQENQIKAIRSFISQRVDYIIFSPLTEDGWDTVLQEAKDAGIPVIVVDRMVAVEDESLYTAWVGSNIEEEGQKAGLWLEQHAEEQGLQEEPLNIVVLQGTLGSTAELGRTKGFNAIASEHQNWNILRQESGDFTAALAKEVMRGMLQQYPDIDVLVSQNDDMTFGALEAIEEAGLTTGADGDILVISFDAVREALELVKDGKINVNVECNPLQGDYILEVIEKLRRGETVEKYNYVKETVFTQENVSKLLPGRTY